MKFLRPMMYRLVKLEGVKPTIVTEVARSDDWRAMEADRDSWTAASLSGDGPGSLAKLRYGVWPI